MKKLILAATLIVATGAMTETSALISTKVLTGIYPINPTIPGPKRCPRPHKQRTAQASFDQVSTTLTVSIPTHLPNGLIEIQSSTSGTSTITVASGTTMSVNMNNYDGDTLTIIVSCGDTIIFYDIIDNR